MGEALREIQLKFHSNNGLFDQQASERYPHASFVLSALYQDGPHVHMSFWVIGATRAEAAQMAVQWRNDSRLTEVSGPFEESHGFAFHASYPPTYSLVPTLASYHLFSFRCPMIARGQQFLTLIGNQEQLSNVMSDLERRGTVQILSARPLSQQSFSDAGGENVQAATLAGQQLRALVWARRCGYYNVPRKITATQIAEKMGISTQSFLYHLRRAESKVIIPAVDQMETNKATAIEAQKPPADPRAHDEVKGPVKRGR